MAEKELEFRERAFLDYLFDGDIIRHPKEAAKLAGYPADYPVLKIAKKLNKELIEHCDAFLALYSPNAVLGLMQLMIDPLTPGSKIKLQVITELLDRSGVTKKEKTEPQVVQPNFMFVLPSKASITDEETN